MHFNNSARVIVSSPGHTMETEELNLYKIRLSLECCKKELSVYNLPHKVVRAFIKIENCIHMLPVMVYFMSATCKHTCTRTMWYVCFTTDNRCRNKTKQEINYCVDKCLKVVQIVKWPTCSRDRVAYCSVSVCACLETVWCPSRTVPLKPKYFDIYDIVLAFMNLFQTSLVKPLCDRS